MPKIDLGSWKILELSLYRAEKINPVEKDQIRNGCVKIVPLNSPIRLLKNLICYKIYESQEISADEV